MSLMRKLLMRPTNVRRTGLLTFSVPGEANNRLLCPCLVRLNTCRNVNNLSLADERVTQFR